MRSPIFQKMGFIMLVMTSFLLAQSPGVKDWEVIRSTWEGSVKTGLPIEVHNLYGDVRLRGSDDKTVVITANAQRKKGDTHQLVFEHQQTKDKLIITVVYKGKDEDTWKKSGKRRLDVSVYIPYGSPLKVRTHKGIIQAKGLKSDIDLFSERGSIYAKSKGHVQIGTRQGNITAALVTTKFTKPTKIESVVGNVEVQLPPDSSLAVEITTGGQITTDYSINIKDTPGSNMKAATTTIGKGEHRLILKSESGGIKLLKKAWLPKEK